MTIKLLVLSTSKKTNRFLEVMQEQAGDDLDIVLHFGDKNAHFKASSLSRMRATTGSRGHLFQNRNYAGAAKDIIGSAEYYQFRDMFQEHLNRTFESNKYKSHPLETQEEFQSYYHLVADAVADEIRKSGATHCLFFNVPHLSYDTIVFQVAKSIGLPITILGQSLFPDRFFSARDPADYGEFEPSEKATPYPIQKGSKPDLFYMKGIKQEREEGGSITKKAIGQFLVYVATKRPFQILNPLFLWRTLSHMQRIYKAFPKWRDPFGRYFHEEELRYYDHLATYEDQPVDMEGDFVYFPLQLQPEMTTATLGGRFRDQAYAIEQLSLVLPAGVRILVKENPKQGAYMRGPIFFERLRRIPSVTLLPSWADTHALTDRARFVAAITGTVGWEAIRSGKPAVVFGAAWYRKLPGIYQFSTDLTYDEIISNPIDHRQLEQAVGALLSHAHEGVIDRYFTGIVDGYDEAENEQKVARTILSVLRNDTPPSFGGRTV